MKTYYAVYGNGLISGVGATSEEAIADHTRNVGAAPNFEGVDRLAPMAAALYDHVLAYGGDVSWKLVDGTMDMDVD